MRSRRDSIHVWHGVLALTCRLFCLTYPEGYAILTLVAGLAVVVRVSGSANVHSVLCLSSAVVAGASRKLVVSWATVILLHVR